MNKTSTYSTLWNRYLRGVFQSARVFYDVAASRTKKLIIRRAHRLYGKRASLLSAAGTAGPDVQLFVHLCLRCLVWQTKWPLHMQEEIGAIQEDAANRAFASVGADSITA